MAITTSIILTMNSAGVVTGAKKAGGALDKLTLKSERVVVGVTKIERAPRPGPVVKNTAVISSALDNVGKGAGRARRALGKIRETSEQVVLGVMKIEKVPRAQKIITNSLRVQKALREIEKGAGAAKRSMGGMSALPNAAPVVAKTRAISRGLAGVTASAGTATAALAGLGGAGVIAGLSGVNSQVSGLRSGLLGLGAAFGGFALVSTVNELDSLSNRLRLLTNNEAHLRSLKNELYEVAQATYSSFTGAGELYARIGINAANLGLAQAEILQLTKSINQAMAIGGATTQEATNAIRQFTQGLASDRLGGEEFRAVAEQAPFLLLKIAEGVGKITGQTGLTIGSLRELAHEGKLNAEIITNAIAIMADDIEKHFKSFVPTIGQGWQNLANGATLYIDELNKASGASEAMSGVLVTMGNNFDIVAQSVLALGGAMIYMAAQTRAAAIASTAAAAATTKSASGAFLAERAMRKASLAERIMEERTLAAAAAMRKAAKAGESMAAQGLAGAAASEAVAESHKKAAAGASLAAGAGKHMAKETRSVAAASVAASRAGAGTSAAMLLLGGAFRKAAFGAGLLIRAFLPFALISGALWAIGEVWENWDRWMREATGAAEDNGKSIEELTEQYAEMKDKVDELTDAQIGLMKVDEEAVKAQVAAAGVKLAKIEADLSAARRNLARARFAQDRSGAPFSIEVSEAAQVERDLADVAVVARAAFADIEKEAEKFTETIIGVYAKLDKDTGNAAGDAAGDAAKKISDVFAALERRRIQQIEDRTEKQLELAKSEFAETERRIDASIGTEEQKQDARLQNYEYYHQRREQIFAAGIAREEELQARADARALSATERRIAAEDRAYARRVAERVRREESQEQAGFDNQRRRAVFEHGGDSAEVAEIDYQAEVRQIEQDVLDDDLTPEQGAERRELALLEYQEFLEELRSVTEENVSPIQEILGNAFNVDFSKFKTEGDRAIQVTNALRPAFQGLAGAAVQGGDAMKQFALKFAASVLQTMAAAAIEFALISGFAAIAAIFGANPALIINTYYQAKGGGGFGGASGGGGGARANNDRYNNSAGSGPGIGGTPKFHDGGIIESSLPRLPGDAADERTVRLQVGERVVSRAGGGGAAAGGGGGRGMTVNIVNPEGVPLVGRVERGLNGAQQEEVVNIVLAELTTGEASAAIGAANNVTRRAV